MTPTIISTLVYLIPAFAGAVLLVACARKNAVFALVALPGTLAHEALHLAAGVLTFARPHNVSVIPRRTVDGRYLLGVTTFANVRWWNAAFVGLAPLGGYVIAYETALVRLRVGSQFAVWDVAIWYGLAQLISASWPSSIDWRLSLRSWPLLGFAVVALWFNASTLVEAFARIKL